MLDQCWHIVQPRSVQCPDSIPDPDLWSLELKIGTSVSPALGNVDTYFSLPCFVTFWVKSSYGTDGRADGRTEGQEPHCGLFETRQKVTLPVIMCAMLQRCWRHWRSRRACPTTADDTSFQRSATRRFLSVRWQVTWEEGRGRCVVCAGKTVWCCAPNTARWNTPPPTHVQITQASSSPQTAASCVKKVGRARSCSLPTDAPNLRQRRLRVPKISILPLPNFYLQN